MPPEIVYATSVISPNNYYQIKVSDYKTAKDFKLFFTILTGNANIYLYKDSQYKEEINKYDYTFRHVHRKEVIEISSNLLENYYIKVVATEPSFIEFKYETYFYNRGYIKMNPNEINIEYVNKQKGFIPFEIHNPDYFYPIDNPKNNDFYFTFVVFFLDY